MKSFYRIFFFFFFSVLLSSSYSENSQERRFFGIINDNHVNLRTQPHIPSDISTRLQINTKVEIIGRSMKKDVIDNYTSYWYEVNVDNKDGWVWGRYINFDNTESKEDGVISFSQEGDHFVLHFVTNIKEYTLNIRSMDVAKSNKYWIVDTTPFWPLKTEIKTFIEGGIFIFLKNGELFNYLKDGDPFYFPENSISPNEELFAVSYGTAGIGRSFKIYTIANLSKIAEHSQAGGHIAWIDNNHFLYSSFEQKNKFRNWPSEDCYYIGISIFTVNNSQSKLIIPPTENSNYYIKSYNHGSLLYSEESGSYTNDGYTRTKIEKTIDITSIVSDLD